MAQYRATTDIYSTTSPVGRDADKGVITTSPPDSGYQVVSKGGVISEELAEKLNLIGLGLVERFDRSDFLKEHEAKSKATLTGAPSVDVDKSGKKPGALPVPDVDVFPVDDDGKDVSADAPASVDGINAIAVANQIETPNVIETPKPKRK